MTKIAVTDYTFTDLGVEKSIFDRSGHSLVGWKEKRTPAELVELVKDADAVITQFAPVNAEVIVRYGIGVDNVDLAGARARAIPVCNIPDYCIDEVADHTLAFILASVRQVVPNAVLLREGKWGLATPIASINSLANLTVGVIGFGRIGLAVVKRLAGFCARVLVFDPVVAAGEIEESGVHSVPFLEDLLPQCDVVTPHCPSTAKTKKMFNAAAFARMKAGSLFINVSRGDLTDSGDLVAALQSGHLGGAALDVFDPEPIPTENPILKMPNVILSAHIASASPNAVQTLRETAAQLVVKALKGDPLPNIVNGVSDRRP